MNNSASKLEEAFIAIWCLVMPMTSILVVPSIQGTTPAYICAFLSLFFVLVRLKTQGLNPTNRNYVFFLLALGLIWLGLLAGSQLGHIIDDRSDFSGAFLINNLDGKILFRSTLFTQSLYFAACLFIFLYFRCYFRAEWMKYVFIGGFVMALYGVYEWLFFLIFKHPGDFIANRMYGEDHPGSWSQTVNFGGLSLVRIKSFFGEPSFYSSALVLYLMIAMNYRKLFLVALLAFNAFFTTSTSCYIGLLVCLLFYVLLTPNSRVMGFLFLAVMICGVIALSQLYPETFRGMFGDKISGDTESGHMRVESNLNTHELFNSFSLMNWIFGLGFGYTYNQVSLAVLANTEIIGFLVFCFAFLKPIWCLPRQGVYGGYKTAIFGLFFLFNLTLSELFLPTTWMFLGLAYFQLDEEHRHRYDYSSKEEKIDSPGLQLQLGLLV